MAYESPQIIEVSMEVSDTQVNFGKDTQEKCSKSCCFGGGKDW